MYIYNVYIVPYPLIVQNKERETLLLLVELGGYEDISISQFYHF